MPVKKVKKKIAAQPNPFLKTAAEAIGTALGKLAVKTGVAAPNGTSGKRSNAPVATKKKAKAPRKKGVEKAAR